jgi:hypothetical protein
VIPYLVERSKPLLGEMANGMKAAILFISCRDYQASTAAVRAILEELSRMP